MILFKIRERPQIKGEKTSLRMLQKEDVAAIQGWLLDGELTELAFGIPSFHPNFQNLIPVYKKEIESNLRSFFAIETKDERKFIGFCCYTISNPQRRARIGILIGDRANWGKGYGRDAVNILARHLFFEKSVETLELDTSPSNLRAQRCFEACGFQPTFRDWKEGRERAWYELPRHRFFATTAVLSSNSPA